jgi:pimeloyl-ACP methyl ester carboxylesterase
MDRDMTLNQTGVRLQAFAIRGLAGGAPFHFSGGMDALAVKLNRIGVACAVRDQGSMLRPYGEVASIFVEALRAAKNGARLALVGHSMGADAALKVATLLAAESVRVPLVVCFDPTAFSVILGPPAVPRNVGRVLSFYQKITPLGRGVLRAGPGFAGELIQERHARIHSRIDDDPQLQDRVIAEFERLQGGT